MAIDRINLLRVIRDQVNRHLTETYIPRDAYSKLLEFKETSDVVVISGIRRCGKSTLLDALRASETGHDFYLNFDDDRLIHFSVDDFQLLLELFLEEYGDQDVFYFDEIQNIPGWERFVRRLHDAGKKVFITGSNATLLSRELGTHLTGRYVLLELYPLSYREIVLHSFGKNVAFDAPSTKEKALLMRTFTDYLNRGGFPVYYHENRPEYLKTLADSIVYRDLVVRYKLRNEVPIKELLHYAASNVGKEISFSNLQKLLGLSNANTVKEYFEYLNSVYLVFVLKSYSPSLKKQAIGPKKLYFIDPGMIHLLGFRPSKDEGRLLENVVYMELLRRGEEIYLFQGKGECDFLLRRGTIIEQAIQVTRSLSNPKTRDREIRGLSEAMDAYDLDAGTILTMDEECHETVTLSSGKIAKVSCLPIWKWMLLG